jgi:three-Cys-motif partner protein
VDVADEGLFCRQPVGPWADEKHDRVSYYAKLFSTGMKAKWDERIYIELYAGAGYSKIWDTTRTIAGSPIRALMLPDPFDKYIFCEKGAEELEALKARVSRTTSPSARVAFVHGDCNERVDEILAEIPAHSPSHRVLSLCFVDPYDIGIKFETLRRLSVKFMDFLVLLALYMDANRNYERYVSEDALKVDEFVGSATWRERWRVAQLNAMTFPKFLAEEYARSMATLEYIPPASYEMLMVRSEEKNLPLYRLALFSRNPVAYSFWNQVRKYRTGQMLLGDGSWQ